MNTLITRTWRKRPGWIGALVQSHEANYVRLSSARKVVAPFSKVVFYRGSTHVTSPACGRGRALRPGRGFERGRLDCEKPPPGRYPPSADQRQRHRPPPLRGGGDAKNCETAGEGSQNARLLATSLILLAAIVGCGGDSKSLTQRASEPSVDDVAPLETIDATEDVRQSDSPAETVVDFEPTKEVTETPETPTISETAVESTSDVGPPPADLTEMSVDAHETPLTDSTEQPRFEPQGDPARIYLPTAAGPLIVDVHVHIDDQNQSTLFHQQIDKVIEDATNGSGEPLEWQQLFDFVEDDPDRFGPIMQNVNNQTRELIRRHDSNRNKRVEHDELVKFLFRDARENVAFRVRGTDYYQNATPTSSSLIDLLDSDRDGHLDSTEVDNVEYALLRLDQNSDQQIELNEIQATNPNDDEIWGRRRTSRHGDVAMDLEGFVDWNLVSYSLDSMRENVPFGTGENSVAKLDENGDGETSSEEAKSLLTDDAHFHVLIEFASGDLPSVQLVRTDSSIQDDSVKVEVYPGQICISGDRLQFVVQVVDRPNRQNRIPVQAFNQFDVNQDGFLDETEIPEAASAMFSFEELDENGDGKLTLREINQPNDSAVPIWSYQVRGRAAEFPDQMFGLLDRDHDRVLSSREIRGVSERVHALSRQSRPVGANDLPVTYVLKFVRGNPRQDAESFRRSLDPPPKERLPSWASQMDTNNDGEISRREFIGTAEQFEKLDLDNDGFLGSHESNAAAAEKGRTG